MKTKFFYITMVLVLATAAFASCVQNNKQQTPKKVKLQYEYNMFCSSEILEFADIEVTYADGNGNLVTDTIIAEQQEESNSDSDTITSFHTNIKIDVVPTRLYMSFRYLTKEGISADTDKSVSTAAKMYLTTVNADQISNFYQSLENPVESVKASELKSYFDKFNENPPALDYTLQELSGAIRTLGLGSLGLVKNN